MKLVQNSGNDRVANLIQPLLSDGHSLDAVTPGLSIFAFAELLVGLQGAGRCRFVLPGDTATLPLLGTTTDLTAIVCNPAGWPLASGTG